MEALKLYRLHIQFTKTPMQAPNISFKQLGRDEQIFASAAQIPASVPTEVILISSRICH